MLDTQLFDLTVTLIHPPVSAEHVYNKKDGDEIPLGIHQSNDVLVSIEDQPKFIGQIVVLGDKLGTRLLSGLSSKQETEYQKSSVFVLVGHTQCSLEDFESFETNTIVSLEQPAGAPFELWIDHEKYGEGNIVKGANDELHFRITRDYL